MPRNKYTIKKGQHISPKTEFKKGDSIWSRLPAERIKEMNDKRHITLISQRKGKTLEEIYGDNKAKRIRENLKTKNKTSIERIHKEVVSFGEVLEKQGYRFIPLIKIRPDAIALKDGKVFAIEVEHGIPKYDKYTKETLPYFDDIHWLIHKKYDKNCRFERRGC